MSIESGPRSQRYDDEGRDDDAPDTLETPAHDEPLMPSRPDHDPAFAGQFNTPEAEEEKRGLLRFGRARLLASVAAGSVVLAGSIYMGVSSDKEDAPTPKETGTSAPAVPGEESPSAAETDSGVTQFETKAAYHETIYDTDLFKKLTPEQQHEVTKLEEMSYQTFRQLPYARQLAYADFYYDAYKDYGMEQVKRSIYYQEDTPETVTVESSGQDILNDFSARQGTIFYSIAKEGSPYNINEKNREESEKALSYLYPVALTESQVYKNRVEQLANLENLEADETSQYNWDGYPVLKADRESIAGDDFGETVKYINVKDSKGEFDQYVFKYTTFTDIQGEKDSVWQLSKILGEGHSQYKPDVESLFK